MTRRSPAHDSSGLHCLLVGNSPYVNRGCEAIVRGTMTVLRRAFGENLRVTAASYGLRQVVKNQARAETDLAIQHVRLGCERLTAAWFLENLNKRLHARTPGKFYMLGRAVRDACVALQLGGDHYSLDYGYPREHMDLDRFLFRSCVPVVIWGASMGPFDKDPAFAAEMFAHLRKISGIYVRETVSSEYLRAHGVNDNVREVADPAFAMEPSPPSPDKLPCPLSGNLIGLNFSPYMSLHVTRGDLDAWRRLCADAVARLLRQTGCDILLVPHVFHVTPHNDDPGFLQSVSAAVREKTGRFVPVLGPALSASEIKWVIARCRAFVGCRTHSTIAALSSGVPTLSLAYSTKARGINRDVYGSQEYCLEPAEVSPLRLYERINSLLENSAGIRAHLAAVVPQVIARAFLAGTFLRECIKQTERRSPANAPAARA